MTVEELYNFYDFQEDVIRNTRDKYVAVNAHHEKWVKWLEVKNTHNVDMPTKCEFIRGHRKPIFGDDEIERIRRMRSDGMSNQKIATLMGVSESTIRNYLKLTKNG